MIHTKKPREQNGRDSFGRYRSQVRSAAIESLRLLNGEIDRIYCDLHDDYVVRREINDVFEYIFVQVKTNEKQSSSWSSNDLIGISNRKGVVLSEEKVKDSFFGKMLLNAFLFPSACSKLIFQTNITLNKSSEKVIEAMMSGDISSNSIKYLADNYLTIFDVDARDVTIEEFVSKLSKISVEQDVQYLKVKDHRFDSYALDYIYEFSEIELSRTEGKIILIQLVELISEKSSGVIHEFTKEKIEKEAAVCLEDLLGVLSISKSAYEILAESGDSCALKSVSVIQRSLALSGANEEQINYCAMCKVAWDKWWRMNRLSLREYRMLDIRNKVFEVVKEVSSLGAVNFSSMLGALEKLKIRLSDDNILYDLDMDELIGAFFAELVGEM